MELKGKKCGQKRGSQLAYQAPLVRNFRSRRLRTSECKASRRGGHPGQDHEVEQCAAGCRGRLVTDVVLGAPSRLPNEATIHRNNARHDYL
ncbi:unnamed protein product [Leptosia nina]|uniref:Uncharacterized protein n=1 Tax=Leptosia nina TaxID=320188 RepID=A0AAV1JMN5_9NEOP